MDGENGIYSDQVDSGCESGADRYPGLGHDSISSERGKPAGLRNRK